MSAKYLGVTFDIHAGGKDLVFPHHENEIAQAEAASGKPFAKVWMHNGFVQVDDEKMSKSLGNFFTIRDVLQNVEPEALRYLLLGTHYRNPINFSDVALADAERRVDYLYETLARVDERLVGIAPTPGKLLTRPIVEKMRSDFNTARALAALAGGFALMNELCDPARVKGKDKASVARTLFRLRADVARIGGVLGLFRHEPRALLLRQRERRAILKGVDGVKVEGQIRARDVARKAKDFASADRIHGELRSLGVEIRDAASGTTWKLPCPKPAAAGTKEGGRQAEDRRLKTVG
jgi:cysteinyl-tRNA synthetase